MKYLMFFYHHILEMELVAAKNFLDCKSLAVKEFIYIFSIYKLSFEMFLVSPA